MDVRLVASWNSVPMAISDDAPRAMKPQVNA